MAASSRSPKLEKRTNRLKLTKGKRYFVNIGKNLSLGYRLGKTGGTWYGRKAQPGNKYTIESLAIADDYREADGEAVLDYFQAQNKVRKWAGSGGPVSNARYTVKHAIDDYVKHREINNSPESAKDAKGRLYKHVIPALGSKTLFNLKKGDLTKWRNSLARVSDDPEDVRRSKDTANRTLSYFKAA